MPALLLINYAFPPFGGAASRRVTKLVKYLERAGWRSVVITSSRINNPLSDESLMKDVPPSTEVIRTASLEPVSRSGHGPLLARLRRIMNVPVVPNITALWAVCAVWPALRAARRHEVAAIVCSAPEFPSFLVGAAVKAWTGLPLVFDYRDEWSYHPEKMVSIKDSMLKKLKQRLEERLEKNLARRADRIIANTEAFAKMFTCRLGVAGEKIEVITNGFDPEDFPEKPKERQDKNKTVITHLGSVNHASLFPPLLIRAMDRAAAESARDVELRMVGQVYPELQKTIESMDRKKLGIRFTGFVPAQKAFELLMESDLNIQVNELLPGKERYHNLKLFDYLYSQKPLLVYGPRESEIAKTAGNSGLARVVEPEDEKALLDFFNIFLQGGFRPVPHHDYIRSFAWPELAGRTKELLDELIAT
ncbi:MAG: glycosyltransferase [bacterium]